MSYIGLFVRWVPLGPCSFTFSRPASKRLLSTSLRPWSGELTSQGAASATTSPRLAVLFQAIDPPVINGVRKPRKPGGMDPHTL